MSSELRCFTPFEQQRLLQFDNILRQADRVEDEMKRCGSLYLTGTETSDTESKQKIVFQFQPNAPAILRNIAFNMHQEYFVKDEKLNATSKDLRDELNVDNGIKEYQERQRFEALWD